MGADSPHGWGRAVGTCVLGFFKCAKGPSNKIFVYTCMIVMYNISNIVLFLR